MLAQYVNYLTLLSCFITGAVVERALGKLVRDQVKRLLLVTILGMFVALVAFYSTTNVVIEKVHPFRSADAR